MTDLNDDRREKYQNNRFMDLFGFSLRMESLKLLHVQCSMIDKAGFFFLIARGDSCLLGEMTSEKLLNFELT